MVENIYLIEKKLVFARNRGKLLTEGGEKGGKEFIRDQSR